MTQDDFTYAVSVPKETTLANTARKSPATAATKPELLPPLTEEGDEWEGFYEDDEYEEF